MFGRLIDIIRKLFSNCQMPSNRSCFPQQMSGAASSGTEEMTDRHLSKGSPQVCHTLISLTFSFKDINDCSHPRASGFQSVNTNKASYTTQDGLKELDRNWTPDAPLSPSLTVYVEGLLVSEAGLDLKYVWVQKSSCDLALFLPPIPTCTAQQEGEEKRTAREHFPFSLHCVQNCTTIVFLSTSYQWQKVTNGLACIHFLSESIIP